VVGARTGQAQTAPNRTQSQLLNQPQVDLEALGLTFELPTTGKLVYQLGMHYLI
jgi:hypothetical protein